MRITMARRLYVSFDRNCPLRLHLVVAFVPTYLKLKSSCVPSISREFELRRNGNCVVSLCDLARQIPHTRGHWSASTRPQHGHRRPAHGRRIGTRERALTVSRSTPSRSSSTRPTRNSAAEALRRRDSPRVEDVQL